VVSYLHPLHTEDTSMCSQGMVAYMRTYSQVSGAT
jgi:hypothetical protein